MTNEMTYLNIQEDVLSLRIENDILHKTIIELQEKMEKMKNCKNCKHWHWKHDKCEKKFKGDCFKNSKWELNDD